MKQSMSSQLPLLVRPRLPPPPVPACLPIRRHQVFITIAHQKACYIFLFSSPFFCVGIRRLSLREALEMSEAVVIRPLIFPGESRRSPEEIPHPMKQEVPPGK